MDHICQYGIAFVNPYSLIRKYYQQDTIDLPTLPLYIVLSESITFVVTLLIFIGILVFTGSTLSVYLVLIPVIYLIQQLFAYALGFFLGMFVVFLRDLKEVVSIVLQIWSWFTPIVYVFSILPSYVQDIMMWNPADAFISAYHDIFVYHTIPSFFYLGILLVIRLHHIQETGERYQGFHIGFT